MGRFKQSFDPDALMTALPYGGGYDLTPITRDEALARQIMTFGYPLRDLVRQRTLRVATIKIGVMNGTQYNYYRRFYKLNKAHLRSRVGVP